ncbi:MAG: hypothetical protein ACO1RX_15155 [Candidatus Sericytochromatia bacterium]
MTPPIKTLAPEQLQAYFPSRVWQYLREAGEEACLQDVSLFLIGGCVRDLLLGIAFVDDVDLVTESPQVGHLARALQARWGGVLQQFEQYGTTKLRLEGLDIDLATARTEIYAYPGANPQVILSDLAADLIRRDFSINALALDLHPERFGQLQDLFHGLSDLQTQQLRALHEHKFTEDPVRSWRGVRLAHTLGFSLESQTREWLSASWADGGFDGFFSARMRHELHKVLRLPQRVDCVRELHDLGVLRCLDPALDAAYWCGQLSRLPLWEHHFPGVDPLAPALLSLLRALPPAVLPRLLPLLELDRPVRQAWGALTVFDEALQQALPVRPSEWVACFDALPPAALWMLCAEPGPAELTAALARYLDTWRWVQTEISGKMLLEWVPPGPQIRQMLWQLRQARLDGQVSSFEQEWQLARALAQKETSHGPS